MIGITARGNAISLQIMLRKRSTFPSREDLPPDTSVVLLAQALGRCWAVIEQAREPKGPRNPPSTAWGSSLFKKESIRDQIREISQGNSEKFDNKMLLTAAMLGLAYNQNPGDPMICKAIGVWSCKLSFSLDEDSVR